MVEQSSAPNDDSSSGGMVDEVGAYNEAESLASLAVANLKRQIESALSRLGDPHLIRARLANQRIKSRQPSKKGFGAGMDIF